MTRRMIHPEADDHPYELLPAEIRAHISEAADLAATEARRLDIQPAAMKVALLQLTELEFEGWAATYD